MANYILNRYETLDAMAAQYLLALALRWKKLEVCILTPELLRSGCEIASAGNTITYFTRDPIDPAKLPAHEVAISVPENEHFLWEVLEYPAVQEYMECVEIPIALRYVIDYVSGNRYAADIDAIAAYMTSGLPMEKRSWDLLVQCNDFGLRQHIPTGLNLLRLERLIAKHYMPTIRTGITIDTPGLRVGSDTVEIYLVEADPITREYIVNHINDTQPDAVAGYVVYESQTVAGKPTLPEGVEVPLEPSVLAIYYFKFSTQAETIAFAARNGLRMNFAGYITYTKLN